MNDHAYVPPREINVFETLPFADKAVQSLFHILCKKWLGDTFFVEFLPRIDYKKRQPKNETLFVPEDVGQEEMIDILETAGKPKNARTTRRAMESPRNELANFLFQKGTKNLIENMSFDSLERHVKNALLSWKHGEKTLKEAFRVDALRLELEEVKKTGNIFLIVDKEIEIADKVQMVLREYPFFLNCQQPAEILKNKSINCRGATVLGGIILSEIGIKYLVGDVPRHSILILLLSNDTLEWRDMLAPAFNEILTNAMVRGFSKTGAPLTLKEIIEWAKDPTPEGLMLDIVGDEYLKKLSWVIKGERQFLTLFPPVLGAQMQVLNGIAFSLAELGYVEKARSTGSGHEKKNTEKKNEYFNQAVLACKLSTAYEPKYEYAYNTMGESLNQLERYEEAIDSFQRSSVINPWNAGCHYGLGKSNFALGRNSQSLVSYKKYIELADPDIEKKWIDKAKEKINILMQNTKSPTA